MSRKVEGVLVLDKASGPTSHDVVASVRRALRERQVGHAGTLDPMATGVMVVLVGEATKLAPYLTAEDKRYEARVVLGVGTDTLDAEGHVVARAPVSKEIADEVRAIAAGALADAPRVRRALEAEACRTSQIPPLFSAIHVEGARAHERARRGEDVALDARPIRVNEIKLLGAGIGLEGVVFLHLALDVSKGTYVRSMARDIGQELGLPAHLGSLRRTASGRFDLAGAIPSASTAEAMLAALVPMRDAVRKALPVAELTIDGALRARHGKPLSDADFRDPPRREGASAWIDADANLVAIGAWVEATTTGAEGEKAMGAWRVTRGFARP